MKGELSKGHHVSVERESLVNLGCAKIQARNLLSQMRQLSCKAIKNEMELFVPTVTLVRYSGPNGTGIPHIARCVQKNICDSASQESALLTRGQPLPLCPVPTGAKSVERDSQTSRASPPRLEFQGSK